MKLAAAAFLMIILTGCDQEGVTAQSITAFAKGCNGSDIKATMEIGSGVINSRKIVMSCDRFLSTARDE